MAYQVLSPFHQCSSIHGEHRTMDEAAKCFDQITQRYNGNIPIHPISGKYIHAIVAIGKRGQQRDFESCERHRAQSLGLDPKAVWEKLPGISTFNHIALLYYEALQLMPSMSINLKGMFDYKNRDKHFWTTDAGIGQALAYTQQAAFTLELSLKALLESLGQLTILDERDWHTHDLVELSELLDSDTKQILERRWNSLSSAHRPFRGSFLEFLTSVRNTYTDLRYVPELTEANISTHISNFRSASAVALGAARTSLQSRSPFRIRREVTTITPEPQMVITDRMVTGTVKSVEIPEGFDPNGVVNVTIESDEEEGVVTAKFLKRSVEDYHGIQGTKVMLWGFCREGEPLVLENPQHFERFEPELSYTQDYRTLQGTVYNLIVQWDDQPKSIVVILNEETYFAKVHCFFSTKGEEDRLIGLSLGDRVRISGLVTLQNGRPKILAGPSAVEPITEEPEI